MRFYSPRRAKVTDELRNKARGDRGKGKVKEGVGANCKRKDHGECSNLRCTCDCHKRPQ